MKSIAFMGNPNSGKTTLFNGITGSNQRIGNWPGVTVEKKEGIYKHNNITYNIVDLPGTYSLGAYSEDEIVARDFILLDKPEVVINVVDSTNLERNLYLTTQLLEMGVKVVVALNMMDEAKNKGIHIDIDKLSKQLGVKVVPTIASKENGLKELMEMAISVMDLEDYISKSPKYSEELNHKVQEISGKLSATDIPYSKDWASMKLLERDPNVTRDIKDKYGDISQLLNGSEEELEDFELEIVDQRYAFINGIYNNVVKKPSEDKKTLTDKIDKIVTNKYLGIPIFALVMFLVFQGTFLIGEDLLGGFVGDFIGSLGEWVEGALISINTPEWIVSFVSEGMFDGVGTVLEFVPLIMTLYFFMGILEDTGYMARAAYVMDGLMRKLGLHGKTFVSMIVGFGCNVPGVMSTRTLENKKDRMIAILINPFMSCGAKIPIYSVFIAAFFPRNQGLVMFLLYTLGILVALIMGKIFSKTLFKEESSDFIMELPPYRLPIFKYVLRDMWDKVKSFLKRAGTTIFVVVSLLWVLSALPMGVERHSEASILGMIGTFIAPIFKPAGFGTWQAAVGLFAGIPAKEAVVATLGMVYAGVAEGDALVSAIQQAFTPLSAVSFMVMTLLYTPCAAVIGTVKKETGSYKWALFISLYTFAIAWIMAVLVYQLGSLMGF